MTVFYLFGATGDLARRKLIPALYRCVAPGDEQLVVLGTGRSDWTDDDFRRIAQEALVREGAVEQEALEWARATLHYQRLEETHKIEPALERAAELAPDATATVYYLAVPPKVFPDLIDALGDRRGSQNGRRSTGRSSVRVVVEKPFGESLQTAQELNRLLHRHFGEGEVYRIDHYLGKDTVQNLLVFRFANALFEAVWDRNHIDRVEITVAEREGADGRARYYDRAGALRDMVQNHLTQLLTLTAMEAPARFDAEGIRGEKIKVLRSIRPLEREYLILGQYTAGVDGEAYRDHDGVSPATSTETFVALQIAIDNWRWQGVPFVMRTGKRLPQRVTEISVYFRRPPVQLFGGPEACRITRNVLSIRLQPDEGFSLGFEVKVPAQNGEQERITLSQQHLHFNYAAAFGRIPDAYETLLRDILVGDQTLFVHADEAEAAWALYQPLLDDLPDPLPYDSGSWGPEAAAALFASDARRPVSW